MALATLRLVGSPAYSGLVPKTCIRFLGYFRVECTFHVTIGALRAFFEVFATRISLKR